MTKTGINSILLASGGMDSTTLAYWLRDQKIKFLPVFINYGQHCADTELKTLLEVLPKRDAARTEVINVSDIYQGCKSRLIDEPNLWRDEITAEDLYLPYRNLLLLSIGAAYAQARDYSSLYAAFINSNHAKELDCSAEFFERLSGVLLEYGSVEIKMPFRELSKYEVAKIGIALKAPIAHTFSCQAASRVPCGACPNCDDRLEAFRLLH
ncbi:MAG TPA: 7-cyano-7-deazaguanine synthase [Pyrinomonadaceae bacterium]|jgi:7-cyano-7-deazaguanine synthase